MKLDLFAGLLVVVPGALALAFAAIAAIGGAARERRGRRGRLEIVEPVAHPSPTR